MKKHFESKIPSLLDAVAVTFSSHVFFKGSEEDVSDSLIRHEREHVKQYKRDGIIGFLSRYFYEYLRGRLSGMDHSEAYHNISYEKEARKVE